MNLLLDLEWRGVVSELAIADGKLDRRSAATNHGRPDARM
jgi:hypothetical protein